MTRPVTLARYAVAVGASACSAGVGIALHSTFGYRFPLISFYPAIMLSAWYGGLWPGVLATGVSTALVDYFWLAPLRAADASNTGDFVAIGLFVGIGLLISGFNESLHRSTVREREARLRAEQREKALGETESRLRDALAGEQAARAEAEHANRHKDQFLAVVSHELRTPLNAVLGWADMLKSNRIDPRRRDRAVESIFANAKRQAELVDDLLDIARMMSGKLQLRRASVDLREIIRAAVEIVQPAADAKRIELACDPIGGIPVVHADGMRLQQIFWNLLSNAIKFTPPHGMVRVGVRLEGQTIEVVITDTGEGIPAEFLRSIFQPFRQADSTMTRIHGGLGLGLSIVKYLIEAHGGTVEAASAGEGRGSTFVVRLPIEPAHQSVTDSVPAPLAIGPATLRGVKALVVDDDADSREVIATLLEQHGATVLSAGSAAEAFAIAQRDLPSVLLVDLAMPGEDGYALISSIRNSPSAIAATPAAALTGLANDHDRDQALAAGFQMHLAKPVESATLVNAVARLSENVHLRL